MGSIELLVVLEDLHTKLTHDDDQQTWSQLEAALQSIADVLRVQDSPEDSHTAFGKSSLPQSLTQLLSLSLRGASVPNDDLAPVVFQLFRVAANLCMDHDINRGYLLDAGFPQAIISLLQGYSQGIPADRSQPHDLSIEHLKVVRTAIGVLLNASIGFDPVKTRLNSLEAGLVILNLATALYPPGSWVSALDPADKISEESWHIRSGLANWAWKLISELKEINDEPVQIFGPDVLPIITPTLRAFTPPFKQPSSSGSQTASFIQADFDILEECCTLIESLALDVDDIRLSLARGLISPSEHGGIPCFEIILDFIQDGTYHPLWLAGDTKRQKSFDVCKAAIIKVVVEVAGEDGNEEVLWDDSEPDVIPGGVFVSKMVRWIKSYVEAPSESARDDLVICASLSLGNLARRERHATILLSPPYSLAPLLASKPVLSPETDIRLKHGILGLLRHLSQASIHSQLVQTALTDANIVSAIAGSGVWDEKTDAMAEVVQVSAIGVVKFLCSANIENTFIAVLPPPAGAARPAALSQVLALVKRSDSVRIKSEGTRVLVNIIRSLWSNEEGASSRFVSPVLTNVSHESMLEKGKKRQDCIRLVTTQECASALASLVSRSGKFPSLVNEGVVALSLLASQKAGAPLILKAFVALLPYDIEQAPIPTVQPSSSTSISSEASSPVLATPGRTRLPLPPRTLEMLVSVLEDSGSPVHYAIEIRMNVCQLFIQLGKKARDVPELAEDLAKVREVILPPLDQIAGGKGEGKEALLIATAKRAAEVLK